MKQFMEDNHANDLRASTNHHASEYGGAITVAFYLSTLEAAHSRNHRLAAVGWCGEHGVLHRGGE